VTLLTDLDAFYLEHRRCGKLDGGVDGPVVWMRCRCDAALTRPDPATALRESAGRDVVLSRDGVRYVPEMPA
jgi:hypothetical protein